jgi:flagellar biosynthesis chaperone FliJ
MAISRAMRRLLRVREIEEELSQAVLESALGDLKLLQAALQAARERERAGRRQVTASAATGELADRISGLELTRAARRHAAALTPRITETELAVASWRREFLAKRTARRQVETLMRRTESEDAIESGRRTQRELDDWFLSRAYRSSGADEESEPE